MSSMSPAIRMLLGFALAVALGLVLARVLGPRGLMDMPRGRHGHEEPTPRVGGLALLVTLLFGLGLGWSTLPLSRLELGCLVAMGLLGYLDDRYGLRARWKALAGLAIAAALTVANCLELQAAQPSLCLFGAELPRMPGMWAAGFILLYWCMPQSVNLIDGAHGLALGYTFIVLAALSCVDVPRLFLPGAVLGILALNWPRPKLFLGDAGSLTLGLLMVILASNALPKMDVSLMFLLFAYPIVDTTLVIAIRGALGRDLGRGDRCHLHHQWMDRLSERGKRWVVPFLWLCAALCASAVAVSGWGWVFPGLGGVLLLGQAVFFFVRSVVSAVPPRPEPLPRRVPVSRHAMDLRK